MIGEGRDSEPTLDPNASALVRTLRANTGPIGPRGRAAEQAGALFARAQVARARAAVARRRRLALVAVGCGAMVLSALGLVRTRLDGSGGDATGASETRALTFTLEDGAPVTGGYIEPAPQGGPRTLSFSDGTRIEIAPRSRARVVETRPEGSRISLEEGKAHVAVVPRSGARWIFEAGPFLINVKGTAFSLGWSGREARFEIQMESGAVSVTGPVSGGEMILKAGQKVAIDLHDFHDQASAPSGPAIGPPAATTVEDPLDTAGGRAGRSAGAAWAPERWAERLSKGRAEQIVGEARRLGLAAALDRVTSEQLATLATAARYQHDDELARRALLVQRRRFPRSTRAQEASFLLGRLDDESRGDMTAALEWYDRYLTESPGGAYTAEALGRKMMALQRSNRQAQAAEIATDYLRRFPTGTYAHAARALVRAP